MKTINVGVIGWGFMGKTHTMALRNIALFYPGIDFEVKLKCVCTRRIEKAQEAMQAAGFESCTDNWREHTKTVLKPLRILLFVTMGR